MTDPSRAVITGIDGFTGAHLSRQLERAGWEVYGLTGPSGASSATTLAADLLDGERIADWLASVRPTHVVHLAALSHVVGPALPFYQVNVLGTEALIRAIDQAALHLSKLVIASSANIYGQTPVSPIGEDERPRPANHYAVSKLAMEALVQQWFGRMPILITRPFNYTGPGQSEAFLFAKLVGAFHRREPVLTLGNQRIARDLSDVSFVTAAYERLLLSDCSSETFNLCSGHSVSIAAALDILRDLTGHDPAIKSDPALMRSNDIEVLTGDPTRLQAAIGPLSPVPPREIFSAMLDALAKRTTS